MRLLLQLMKKKLKLDEISAIKKERKKDGNRQPNKVTNTCMIHQGTKGTPYHPRLRRRQMDPYPYMKKIEVYMYCIENLTCVQLVVVSTHQPALRLIHIRYHS